MVGGALVRALHGGKCGQLVTATRSECDLLRQSDVEDFMATQRPQVVIVAAASGIVAYGVLMLVLRAMRRSQTGTVAGLRAAIGTIGELSMEIPAGGWGQVRYLDSESVRAVTNAVLVDPGASARPGESVLIVDVDGDRLVVQPLNTQD